MSDNRTIGLFGGLMAHFAAPLGALAQSAPDLKSPQTEMKTIGVPSNAKTEIVPSLIVMNSQGATCRAIR